MDFLGIGIFAGVLLIIVAAGLGIFLGQRTTKKKTAELQALATSRGWRYTERDTGLARQWKGAPFSGGGTANRIVTFEHRGRGVSCFTYTDTSVQHTSSGTSTRTSQDAVFVVLLPADVPDLSVGAEGLFGGKIAERLGFDRVDLDDEDFNDVFKVKSDDEQFARMVLQPAVVRQLKLTGPWDWRFTNQVMISWESGALQADDIIPRLDRMCDLLDAVPDIVWQRRPPVGTTE